MRGYLLIHGFAGSPQDLLPVARRIKSRGGTVSSPLLAGHGGNRDRMRGVRWKDWVTSAEQGFRELERRCTKVSVIGFSMGAMIGAILADRHPVERLVMMSPPVLYTNPPELVMGAAKAVRGRLQDNRASTEYLKEYFRRLFRAPVRSLNELHQLIRATQPVFSRLTVPTLILQGARDDLAHPKGAKRIFEQIPAQEKKLILFPNSRHLLCSDCEREQVVDAVEHFLHLDS